MTLGWSRCRRLAAALAVVVLGACANVPVSAPQWAGRLSLKVYTEPLQALNANFSLSGGADDGSFVLSSALGTTLARMEWHSGNATLHANGQTLQFRSLQALVWHATGTDLPVGSLFAWLNGQNAEAIGWKADLAAMDRGVLRATRSGNGPRAELQVVLER